MVQTLKIPCDLLRPRVRGIDARCSRDDIANLELVPAVRELAAGLLKMPEAGESLRLQDAVLDLVGLMVETAGRGRETELARGSMQRLMYDRLHGDLARHFRDAVMVEGVAAAHKISARCLHLVFSHMGTTFGRALLELRLREAERLLSRPTAFRPRPHVSQVAYACGFSSPAHFSSRYRERFGMAPSDVLDRARSPVRREALPTASSVAAGAEPRPA